MHCVFSLFIQNVSVDSLPNDDRNQINIWVSNSVTQHNLILFESNDCNVFLGHC